MRPVREFDPTLDTPAVKCPEVIWEQVPQAVRMFTVKARLAGIPVRIGTVSRLSAPDQYVVVGPRGHISAISDEQLLCACQSMLAGVIRLGLDPDNLPRTYVFDLSDEPACCAALINIGVAELPSKLNANAFAEVRMVKDRRRKK